MPLEELVLRDSQATARILPGFGFNLYSYQCLCESPPTELLWAHPDFTSGDQPPSHSGIPLLFPFPGRIGGTTLHCQGRHYPLEAGDGAGNAIHGFVLDRPWRVLEARPTRAVGQFQASVDDPTLLRRWPTDFCITVTYELRAGVLASQIRVENPDERPLPFGLGTHAYFRLPSANGGRAADCIVTVPAAQAWQLVDLRPTGQVHDVTGPADLRGGKRFGDCHLDDVLTGLRFENGKCTTAIRDPVSGRALTQRFDTTFRHCVVYTPPHREAICMEPYTCVPDPFRLQADGIQTGLQWLASGQSHESTLEVQLVT